VSDLFAKRVRWKKLGLILPPQPERQWWQSHSMVPTPLKIDDNKVRLYFSGRNNKNQSHIGWATIDLCEPTRVLEVCNESVLAPGPLGCFDDNGVTPSSVVTDGNETLLYYIGWNPGSTVRMHIFGGLAISRDGGLSFERWSNAPIIERNRVNPYLNTAPFVMKDGANWRMYYVSCTEWKNPDLPRYNIQIAESTDGRSWKREGRVAIPYRNDSENALARPFVLREDGVYKMWFAHRGDAYRMGYAESRDGLDWKRDDALGGLDVTPGGFDSQMVEYFAIVPYEGRKIMFYNGDDFGRHGVGVAIEE
jgi:predicted GH43/DUF377 family glycosyl hydrolase